MIYFVTRHNYLKCHNHRRPYRRITSVGISQRIRKQLFEMPPSPTSIPTDLVRRHFTESSKTITWNATITDVNTKGLSPSAFHKEFENNYLKCHNHRRLYRRIKSVGKFSAGEVHRQHYWQTARIPKGCALNASLTASSYRRTTKNMEGH